MSTHDDTSDFTDLVTRLVDETFEAIMESQAEQAKFRTEILKLTQMSQAQYALDVITDEDVNAATADLLGTDSLEDFVAEITGSDRNVVADAVARGSEAIDAVFGGRNVANQLKTLLKTKKKQAIQNMFDGSQWRQLVREQLAEDQYATLMETARSGMPRLLVDGGKITARTKLVVSRKSSVSEYEARQPMPAARANPPIGSPSPPKRGGLKRRIFGRKRPQEPPKLALRLISGTSSAEHENSEGLQEIEIEFEIDFRTES